MSKPEVGQVWEKDGERREVDAVEYHGTTYHAVWYDEDGQLYDSLADQWQLWASRATLVEPKE